MSHRLLAGLALCSAFGAFAAPDPSTDRSFDTVLAADVDDTPITSLGEIGDAALREPATLEMMALGVLGLIAVGLHRRKAG